MVAKKILERNEMVKKLIKVEPTSEPLWFMLWINLSLHLFIVVLKMTGIIHLFK